MANLLPHVVHRVEFNLFRFNRVRVDKILDEDVTQGAEIIAVETRIAETGLSKERQLETQTNVYIYITQSQRIKVPIRQHCSLALADCQLFSVCCTHRQGELVVITVESSSHTYKAKY